MSAFTILNAVDVSEHVEQKNRLTYLSWAWAWAELKKRYPNSFYTIYENASGCFYHTDGKTCWVKTGVTVVDGEYSLEHIEYLPVMDFKNASIPVDKVTSFEVNKAIQRSLTKAVARHGLGLYIYAGEDLPEGSEKSDADVQKPKGNYAVAAAPSSDAPTLVCDACGGNIFATSANTSQQYADGTKKKTGMQMCANCYKAWKAQQAEEAAAVSRSDSARAEAANDDAGDRK